MTSSISLHSTSRIHLVVIAEPASPNTVVVAPIVARIAQALPRCDFWAMEPDTGLALARHILRDTDQSSEFAGRDLPLMLVLDSNRQYLGRWGPHPAGFAPRMKGWFAEHPDARRLMDDVGGAAQYVACAPLAHQLLHEMRIWYNSGLGAECANEVRALLEGVRAAERGAGRLR